MLDRRTFISSLATLPLVRSGPRVTVVGAGAFGGWTALHLLRNGANVTLVDAWGAGHTRASSGGETRVIRSIYGRDRIYVEMVKRSYELWGELDPTLYSETGVLWMHRGDDAYVKSSLPIVRELGFPVDELSIAGARLRYPQISFDGIQSAYLERHAGALSARRACGIVRDLFIAAGGTYRIEQVQPSAVPAADVTVFACGPWLGKLFPDVIGEGVRPTRQEVYYFGTPRGSNRYAPPQMPVWIDFGEKIYYGIPDIHGRGFKVADDTRGEAIDPTSAERKPTPAAVEKARALLGQRFPELAKAPLIAAEVCQYENSPDGHLILGRHPGKSHVWLAGGGSGHGFKLSPAFGEMAARAILADGEIPELFSPIRLANSTKPKTQFDRR